MIPVERRAAILLAVRCQSKGTLRVDSLKSGPNGSDGRGPASRVVVDLVQEGQAVGRGLNRILGVARPSEGGEGTQVIAGLVAQFHQGFEFPSKETKVGVGSVSQAETKPGMHVVAAGNGETPPQQGVATLQDQGVIRMDGG